MRVIYNISFLLGLFFSYPLMSPADSIKEIIWTDSFLNPEDQVPTERLKFGYLMVPENYEASEGRKIKIAFVIIKAAVKRSHRDASIYFKGGWGSQTIQNLSYYQGHFLSYERDLILYDYRGTGYSEPSMCEDLGGNVLENLRLNLSYQEFEQRQVDLFEQCLADLADQGIDYHQYGSDNKARDGVELAKALGYESYNLFGVSYGTKTILQFIRQATVPIRATILDSNCPLDYPINAGMTADYAQSLDKVLTACENDPNCQQKYQGLREEVSAFLLSLDQKPLKVKLSGGHKFYLNRQEVNAIIHQLLYYEWSIKWQQLYAPLIVMQSSINCYTMSGA